MAQDSPRKSARRPARSKGGAAAGGKATRAAREQNDVLEAQALAAGAAEEQRRARLLELQAAAAAMPARPVERFPRRVGRKIVQDRPLTPVEARAYGREQEALESARSFRQRKRAENRVRRGIPEA